MASLCMTTPTGPLKYPYGACDGNVRWHDDTMAQTCVKCTVSTHKHSICTVHLTPTRRNRRGRGFAAPHAAAGRSTPRNLQAPRTQPASEHCPVKCTVHILCLYGDTVHLRRCACRCGVHSSTPAINEGCTRSLRISHTSRRDQVPCTPYHPPNIAGVTQAGYTL
jgi:hypothetical protein